MPPDRIVPTMPMLKVLDVLLADDEKHYGFELSKATGLKSGTLYPILARLERFGWLESEWEESGENVDRPRRRYYTLTAMGAREALASIARVQSHVARFSRPSFGGATA